MYSVCCLGVFDIPDVLFTLKCNYIFKLLERNKLTSNEDVIFNEIRVAICFEEQKDL